MTFQKKATKFFTALLVFRFFSFTAVADGSSVRSLTSTFLRQNQSAHCCWGIIFTSSPAIRVHERQPCAVHPPLRRSLSSGSSGKIAARSPWSCSTTECLRWAACRWRYRSSSEPELPEVQNTDEAAAAGWMNEQPVTFCFSSSAAEDACVIAGGWKEPKWMLSPPTCSHFQENLRDQQFHFILSKSEENNLKTKRMSEVDLFKISQHNLCWYLNSISQVHWKYWHKEQPLSGGKGANWEINIHCG